MLEIEIILGHALNVIGSAAQITRQFGVDQAGIFSDHSGSSERDRLFFIGIATQNKTGNFLILGLLQFPGFDGLSLQTVQYGDQRLLAIFRRVAGIHNRVGPVKIRIFGKICRTSGLHRDLILVDQSLVETATFAAGKNVGSEVERIGIGRVARGNLVTDDNSGKRRVGIGLLNDPLGVLRRFGMVYARNRFSGGRDAIEIFPGPEQRLLGIEIADDDQRGVVRFVEGVEELADVFDFRAIEIGHAADGGVMVGVLGKGRGAQILFQVTVGLVFDPDATFFFYDFALGFEIFFGNVEAAHAVRFEPQNSFQVIAGESFEKIRGVVSGFRIVEPADGFDDSRMFFSRNMRRALEHQVLEEVRETGAAGQFVFGSHVIPNLEVDDRNGVIFEENY